MKLLPCVLASCFMVAIVDAADETKDKIDKNKLVGVWELKKGNPDLVPIPGDNTRVEFTKDGEVKVVSTIPMFLCDTVSLIQKGSYKVDGNKLTIDIDDVDTSMGIPIGIDPKERIVKVTITKLTDKVLHVKNKKGKLGELSRKK